MNKLFFASIVAFVLVSISSFAFAQKGIIRGTIIEDSSGEPLFGVTVIIKGTTTGAVTDFDGKFEIKVEPGVYDLQASFVSYKTTTISQVEVKEGDVTVFNQIRMLDDIAELQEVIVTADVIRQSETALLTIKRKSVNVIDGISSENFKKIGDSDAGAAAKRVTGVSVEGGKYVYVRGLGDRYTKTTLNGLDIPGLDPDRNSIQMDVFPTNLIDNLVVLKSFTPDLPADFTGGIVNIETKDFPEKKIFDVSASLSFNPNMHFNSDYITYEGSSTDFLGFDNGERDLPAIARGQNIPNPFENTNEEVDGFLQEFSPTLGAINQTSFADVGLGITYGDQLELGNGHKVGYLVSGNYKNQTVFYDDVFFGEFQNDRDPSQSEFQRAFTQTGSLGRNNVLLGGLAGIAYKTNSSKFKLNLMHLQNGESSAGQFQLIDDDAAIGKSGYLGNSDNLEYIERSVTNAFLSGEHHLAGDLWDIDWRASITNSSQYDPDIRKTAYTEVASNLRFVSGGAGNPSRLWRELDESNIAGKIDVTRNYQFLARDAKFKFGVSQVFKERDYEILDYNVLFFGSQQPEWTGDATEVWTNNNLFPNGSIYLVSGVSEPNSNQYNATVSNTGFYFLNEFSITEKLKSIVGLRAENFVQRHTGRDQLQVNTLDDEKVLDSFDLFPSLNLIFGLSERQNLRGSYSRTIARPSFKELSFAQILDPVSNRIFNGGLFAVDDWNGRLVETRIDNLDLRWEMFMDRGQLLSVSAFYKAFDNPIELVRLPQSQTVAQFQPRNVGNAQLFGLEFEFRKALDFVSTKLEKFSVTGNFTFVESSLDISSAELRNRRNNAREGESIEDTRTMAGQAPWIVNAGFAYNDPEKLLDAGLYYNVKGETLAVVGGGIDPDVFTEPFHSLNFNLNKTVGAKEKLTLNFSISNILGDKREQFFQREGATEQLFQSLNPGTSIGVGIKYAFK
ncbi:MAG: TonB-dependent receptor [Bacteroidota bacterium]